MEDFSPADAALRLAAVLDAQRASLASAADAQAAVRAAVLEKNWERLTCALASLDAAAARFSQEDAERARLTRALAAAGGAPGAAGADAGAPETEDFYAALHNCPAETRAALRASYAAFRRSLFASRAASGALRRYLDITLRFLRGIFDSALPSRRCAVYSPTGALVRSQPESIVLNTLT